MSRKCVLAMVAAVYLVLSTLSLYAQESIGGPTCVTYSTNYSYMVSGSGLSNSTPMTWSCGGCTFQGTSSGTPCWGVSVKWSSSGWLKCQTTSPNGSATINVTIYNALSAGIITSGGSQTINYNYTPANIVCTAASGGYCTPSYTYQWYSSSDDVNFNSMSGQTSLTLNFGTTTLTQTMYYKLKVTETNTSTSVWYPVATVTVYPQLVSGTISPSSLTANFNQSPTSAFSISGTHGGNGTYSYAWQICATSNGTYTPISGATSSSYTPSGQVSNMWYEVVQTSNGVPVTSSPVELIVNPQVFSGTISPGYLVITSGTSPGTLTGNAASGGNCSGSYTYQWQNSPNGTTWTTITGATSLSYAPGTLTSTTWYRRQVTCGTDAEYSNAAEIVIGAPNTNYNFIRVRNILKAGVADTVTADGLTSAYDVAQTTEYLDGVGRLVQTVAKQASPLQNDVVQPVVYDNFGRQATDYLPYTATANDGNYKPTALQDQEAFNSAQFPGEQVYYGQVNFEASNLNRPLVVYAPGASWIGSGNGQASQYMINTVADSVQIWTISSSQLVLPVDAGSYGAGELIKNIGTDEQGHQVVTYIDKFGKDILKKTQVNSSPSSGHAGWLCTYYVYDTLQNLRVVIQPQAVVLINGSWTINQTIANQLCFRYEYDGRRNMAIKKLPGVGQKWMVYDARGRLAMVQDSTMRSAHEWMFAKYDSEDRQDSTGFIVDPTYYDSLAHYDTLAYSSTNFPTVSAYTSQLLTQSFYDDYSWVSTYGAPVASSMATGYTNSNYFITSYNTFPTYAISPTPFVVTRGMPTGSIEAVIGTGSSNQYLYATTFYDDHGRPIQTQKSNYTGTVDTATMQYDFKGALLRMLINHKKGLNTSQNHIVVTKIDYDAGFRIRHIWKNIDNAPSDQLIDSLQYNELGQLRSKYLGNEVDSEVYSYNIRGWLTGINKNYVAGTTNHYFGMELGYNSTSSMAPGNIYLNPELNGNVEGVVWKSAGSQINRKYDFTYDPANRLTSAAFLQNTSGTSWDKNQIDFSVSNIRYDANGNLLTLTQRGFMVNGSAPIDSLFYTYQNSDSSNILMGVWDSVNNPNTLLEDFHYNPSTKLSTDYNYDGNGNLLLDNNKNISSITYNYLNLPQVVHFKGEGNITYTYDAEGNKLLKVITDSVAQRSTTITYIAGFIYQQTAPLSSPGSGTDTLQLVGHEEGRIRWAYQKFTTGSTGYSFQYDFFERDHLGNTRAILTQERDTSNYLATMEAAYRATESQLFGNIASTSAAWTSMPNYTSILSGTRYLYTNPNDSVSKVDSTSAGGQKVGPNLLLKVMSGDTVNFTVQAYYVSPGGGSTNYSSFSDVLNSLSNGLVNLTGGAHGTVGNLTQSGSNVYNGLTSFLGRDSVHTGYPKAYINWIFLDNQFNYDSALSGAVPAASGAYPAGSMNPVAPGGPVILNRSGYLYIWVSNETSGWDVYYDNLSVQYKQGPLLEENDYYPFGLTMAGTSDKAIKTNYLENKYRYNDGSELQNREFNDGTGLEMYETNFRGYDPQIGRFTQFDPLASSTPDLSPYQFAANNPGLVTDPTGATLVVHPAPSPCVACGYDLLPGCPSCIIPIMDPTPPSAGFAPDNGGGDGGSGDGNGTGSGGDDGRGNDGGGNDGGWNNGGWNAGGGGSGDLIPIPGGSSVNPGSGGPGGGGGGVHPGGGAGETPSQDQTFQRAAGRMYGLITLRNKDGETNYNFQGDFLYNTWDNTFKAVALIDDLAYIFQYNVQTKDFKLVYFGDQTHAPPAARSAEDYSGRGLDPVGIVENKFEAILQELGGRNWVNIWQRLREQNHAWVALQNFFLGTQIVVTTRKQSPSLDVVTLSTMLTLRIPAGLMRLNLDFGVVRLYIASAVINIYLGTREFKNEVHE